MKLMRETYRITLEDFAKEYAGSRVERLVHAGNWCDRYPDCSSRDERLSDLEEKLLEQVDEANDIIIYSSTAMMYAKALAREAYMLGILDDGHIQ